MDIGRPVPTHDTPPNQFLKFALLNWRALVSDLNEAMSRGSGPTRDRAVRETDKLTAWLDDSLALPLLRAVGSLTAFPAGNPVLAGRAGYREFLSAYLLSEIAGELAWSGGESVYRAGQRDMAALYEYWCFIQIAKVSRGVCGALASEAAGGSVAPVFDLKRGQAAVIAGETVRLGRKLYVELTFNRNFGPSLKPTSTSSWARQMRPDCSLRISDAASGQEGVARSIWLHFYAKYRIDNLSELFLDEPDPEAGHGAAKRDDLLKMHAYRDAIHGSAGAYVLYPGILGSDGSDKASYREFHEILPGLGAFALRPTQAGNPAGEAPLRLFVHDALDHFASALTQHQRGSYWEQRSYWFEPISKSQNGVAADSGRSSR